MDGIDIKILTCLRENSRMNASHIGEKVGMSVSAVIERIKRLEAAGVIKQYTVVLDNKTIGKETTAFISVCLEHPKYNDSFNEAIQEHPHIVECHYITGDFDYILKIITTSTQGLERILNYIKSIRGVSLTKTIVTLSTVKQEPSSFPDSF